MVTTSAGFDCLPCDADQRKNSRPARRSIIDSCYSVSPLFGIAVFGAARRALPVAGSRASSGVLKDWRENGARSRHSQ